VALVLGVAAAALLPWRPARAVETEGELYGALLNDVAAGRVTTIDDHATGAAGRGYVMWRTRSGAVYVTDAWDVVDLRASVAAQPAVREHPGAVRYARIDRPLPERFRPPSRLPAPRDVAGLAVVLLWLAALVTGPEPRRATRWGWFVLGGTGVGILGYVLLSGSQRRTTAERAPRLSFLRAFGLAFVVNVVVAFTVAPLLRETTRPNEALRRDTVRAVLGPPA
jgi:hypothetical protein